MHRIRPSGLNDDGSVLASSRLDSSFARVRSSTCFSHSRPGVAVPLDRTFAAINDAPRPRAAARYLWAVHSCSPERGRQRRIEGPEAVLTVRCGMFLADSGASWREIGD